MKQFLKSLGGNVRDAAQVKGKLALQQATHDLLSDHGKQVQDILNRVDLLTQGVGNAHEALRRHEKRQERIEAKVDKILAILEEG